MAVVVRSAGMNDEAKAAEVAAFDGGKNLLSSKDLILGTALAIIMGTVFAKLGGGHYW